MLPSYMYKRGQMALRKEVQILTQTATTLPYIGSTYAITQHVVTFHTNAITEKSLLQGIYLKNGSFLRFTIIKESRPAKVGLTISTTEESRVWQVSIPEPLQFNTDHVYRHLYGALKMWQISHYFLESETSFPVLVVVFLHAALEVTSRHDVHSHIDFV